MKRKVMTSKLLAMAITATTAMGAFSPMVAHAASPAPSEKVAIDSSVATVAAHRAAETTPMILGANLTTTGGVNDVMLDTFGSDYNIRPNQYLYNYRVDPDQEQDDVIKVLATQVSPMMADVSGVSTGTEADIYLGNQANGGVTYESILGNSYVYTTLAYNCNDIEAMKTTMNSVAAAMNTTEIYEDGVATGEYKTGLYGDPSVIAAKYSNYIDGTVSYINSHVSADNKKTVAILSKNANGQYVAYTPSYRQGTSINRASEYLATTTNNIAYQVTDSSKIQNNGNGSYTILDNSVLSNVDAFVLTAFQGSNMKDEDLTGFTRKSGAIVFDSMPDSSYGIFMNSAENALGMVSMIMGIYEGTPGVNVTVEDAVAYYYSNFYHIKPAYIDDLANAHFDGNRFNYSGLASDSAAATAVSNYAAILAE